MSRLDGTGRAGRRERSSDKIKKHESFTRRGSVRRTVLTTTPTFEKCQEPETGTKGSRRAEDARTTPGEPVHD